MAFCNEPEIHHGMNGCVCDPVMGSQGPCSSSAAIISQFEVESSYIRTFEQQNNASNVQVAEISWAGYYSDGTHGCSVNPTSDPDNFLVPGTYVGHYLVDIYEGGNGNPIQQPEELDVDQAWDNWVTCTRGGGASLGIAEFAINCGNEQQYQQAVAESYGEDAGYLEQNFPNLYVWNLWDSSPNCSVNSNDEPNVTEEWHLIAEGISV